MKPYVAVLWGISAWAVMGCLELGTQNPSNGVGGAGAAGGAGGGGGSTLELCGNGKIDSGEECDDGNMLPGDACSPQCTLQFTSSLFVGMPGMAGFADGIGQSARLSDSTALGLFGDTLFLGEGPMVRMVDIPTAKVTTIAGASGAPGYMDAADGLSARFQDVRGLGTDGTTLWIADFGNSVLRAISLTPPYAVTTVAGTFGMSQAIDGIGTSAGFQDPRGIAYYNGLVYFLDAEAATLRSFHPVTKEVKTLSGQPYNPGHVDGFGAAAQFSRPRALVADGLGSLYIADTDNRAIRKYDINTAEVKTIAGSPMCGYADGPGLMARLNFPRGISFDGQNIYWLESQAHTVRRHSPASGDVWTISGTAASCAPNCTCISGMPGAYAEGTGSLALWSLPYDSIYHPASKSIFVSDSQNYVIRRIQ